MKLLSSNSTETLDMSSDTHRYSMYQPLLYKHQIGIFPGSHKYSSRAFQLHASLEWKIINYRHCAIIMDSQLVHRALSSREEDGTHQVDPRFFSYLYVNQTASRQIGRRTELGNEMCVHRNLCPLFDGASACYQCSNIEAELGKRNLSHDQLYPFSVDIAFEFGERTIEKLPEGTVLLGDLKLFGFEVIKSVHVSGEIGKQIYEDCRESARRKITRDIGQNRHMLFEVNFMPNSDGRHHRRHFEEGDWNNWLQEVLVRCLSTRFGTNDIRTERTNVIFNNGPVTQLQLPHTDFQSSSS